MHPHQPEQHSRGRFGGLRPSTDPSSVTRRIPSAQSLLLVALAALSVACTSVAGSPLDDAGELDRCRALELDVPAGPAAGDDEPDDVDWGDPGGSTAGLGSGGQGAAPVADPQPSRLVEVPLGDVPVGETRQFAVNAQTLGFTTIIHSPSADGTVGLERLEAPGGELLVDDFLIERPNWEVWWNGTTVASVPQTDAASAMPQVMPGPWSLQVADRHGSAQSAEVSVWRRETDDGAFHGGWLDVNVLIAGETTTESYLRPVLEHAFHGYAGLHLGEIEFFEIGAAYAVVDQNNFDHVVRQTAMVDTAPALNVIVIADFTGWLEGAAGVAAGIPGQGIEHGTNASAVLLEHIGNPRIEIDVLRHEAGHLAGLFHTTEIDELGVDPLGETPECSDVIGLLYDCPDADNLMFPIVMANDPAFTDQQHRVIEGSSLYRAELIDGSDSAEALGESAIDPAEHDPGLDGGGSIERKAWTAPAPKHGAHRPLGGWAAGLDPQIATLLAGGWCAPQPQGASRSTLHDALRQLGAESAPLLALGSDPTAPGHVRKRALRTASRLLADGAPDARKEALTTLTRLAQDSDQPRAVRLGALGGLQHIDPARRQAAADAMRFDADPVLAELAHR